jgi:hypothetical protein
MEKGAKIVVLATSLHLETRNGHKLFRLTSSILDGKGVQCQAYFTLTAPIGTPKDTREAETSRFYIGTQRKVAYYIEESPRGCCGIIGEKVLK